MEEPRTTEIEQDGWRWAHLRATDQAATGELRKRFGFHELDLKDVLPPLQRPKLIIREGYRFMILLFPHYHAPTREILISEVDFFIGRDVLVTVNNRDEYAPLAALVARTRQDAAERADLFRDGIGGALYRILDALHQAAFPMLVHISQDIDELENGLFDPRASGTVEGILRVKTNLVNFRRAMQGHKPVLEKLLVTGNGILETKKLQAYWSDLLDVTKEIWAFLETQRDTITALHETHTSLISYRINLVIKRLTIVSVVLLPLTLLASLFGMNFQDIPFTGNPLGFWIAIALMAVTFLGVLQYFRSKDWI